MIYLNELGFNLLTSGLHRCAHMCVCMCVFAMVTARCSGLATIHLVGTLSTTMSVFPTLLHFIIMFDGYFVASYNMPVYYNWLFFISIPHYLMQLAMNIAFADQDFSCSHDPCPTGRAIISAFGYDTDVSVLWTDAVGLLLTVVGLRVLAFALLKWAIRSRGSPWSELRDLVDRFFRRRAFFGFIRPRAKA